MLFDSPQWLWGTALALLVPIIHLLGQRSIKPIPIPSLMWLDKFKTQDRRRNKLKEWLLVLLRMLVIALFFFSLASPRIPRDSTTILIDNSPALAIGWQPRDADTAIRDGAQSLVDLKIV